MARSNKERQPARAPAADVEGEVRRVARLSIVDLRREWRQVKGSDPQAGLTKDLMARALTCGLQERAFGGLSPSVARMLREFGKPGIEPRRHVKAGSIIVREYEGTLHEVLGVPGGFCWQGKTFDSLSTIAKRITGTNWNGPRFFGLRSKRVTGDPTEDAGAKPSGSTVRAGRRSSIEVVARGSKSLAHVPKPQPTATASEPAAPSSRTAANGVAP